jgi:Eco47II restriction endonuclease.
MVWRITFISEEDFEKHVRETIKQYGTKLKAFDLKKFNSNLIDPIKFLFDKNVYNLSWEEIIKNEIFRQRDKSNSNDIGYFHQKIFQYIQNCEVPKNGWDIIFKTDVGIPTINQGTPHTAYCELKNKHNTMNSSSGNNTYIKMQNQLLEDDDCICYLVEVIAKKSQNIAWEKTIDNRKYKKERLRRISIDKFYEIVTGEKDAFFQICRVLPNVIEKVLKENPSEGVQKDTVIKELKNTYQKDEKNNILMAMYLLGFETYNGFNSLKDPIMKTIEEYSK